MGAKEPNLTPEIVASLFLEEDIHWLGKKFCFATNIQLEAPGVDEYITEGTATRVAFHKESLNAGFRIPMLSTMAKLLWWY